MKSCFLKAMTLKHQLLIYSSCGVLKQDHGQQ